MTAHVERRLSGIAERRRALRGDRRVRPSGPRKPAAVIGCPVCLRETARFSAVCLRDGCCTVTYQCTACGRIDDRVLPFRL
jgi:hypothetical protein